MGAKLAHPYAVRETLGDHLVGHPGQHGLTAVSQIPEARSAIDRRAHVVALVPQLDLAGVHADAQPQRCKRRQLQLQGTGHRIACAGEGNHEAVAFALFDRTNALMLRNDFGQHLVEARHRCRHLLRLALPEPSGPLDVGEKQRRHPRWQ
jgi:hypothetical protein